MSSGFSASGAFSAGGAASELWMSAAGGASAFSGFGSAVASVLEMSAAGASAASASSAAALDTSAAGSGTLEMSTGAAGASAAGASAAGSTSSRVSPAGSGADKCKVDKACVTGAGIKWDPVALGVSGGAYDLNSMKSGDNKDLGSKSARKFFKTPTYANAP